MFNKVVAAHQPNFMPYLGFFDKLEKSDIFVIRDEVAFTKKDFHHRNRIRINGRDNVQNPQSTWIGVPVVKEDRYLQYIRIKQDALRGKRPWKKQLEYDLKTHYKNTPYFDEHFLNIMHIIENSQDSLCNMNIQLITYIAKSFGIHTRIVRASELGLRKEENRYDPSNSSQDLVDICKGFGGDIYLSGDGGKDYLQTDVFDKAGIELRFQEYEHPIYQQNFDGFLPYMSSLDALFCLGKYPKEAVKCQNFSRVEKEVLNHEFK